MNTHSTTENDLAGRAGARSVREGNVIERAVDPLPHRHGGRAAPRSPGSQLAGQGGARRSPLDEALDRLEREMVRNALEETNT